MKLLSSFVIAATLLASASSAAAIETRQAELPVVDLGYARYRASAYNATSDIYLFSNIRFAAPPTGNRRFAAPSPPLQEPRDVINDGSYGHGCPPGVPGWVAPPEYTVGTFVGEEDCLFLDVWVPRAVFEKRKSAAVMHWMFSGGFVVGSKNTEGNPTGIIQAADSPVIYVSANYRLGAFGWLSGPTFKSTGGGTAVENAGFTDQLAALNWIQNHISKFGGNKNQVTVFGQSAGGSSILHHITASGGKSSSRPPFNRAILQSPGYRMIAGDTAKEEIYTAFEAAAGCAGQGVSCLRSKTTAELKAANLATIHPAQIPGFGPGAGYGPVVDGTYVPDFPGKLLSQGKFHKGIPVIAAHVTNEGATYTNPFVTDATFTAEIRRLFPTIPQASLDEIVRLYPVASASTPYTTALQRTQLVTKEASFACNAYFASKYIPLSWRYQFDIGAATHGNDLPYTFYNGEANPRVTNPAAARAMQEWFTDFATDYTPNWFNVFTGVPWLELYSLRNRVLKVQQGGFVSGADELRNERCEFWLRGEVY